MYLIPKYPGNAGRERKILCVLVCLCFAGGVLSQENPTPIAASYPWEHRADINNALAGRIAPPDGYTRVSPSEGSFGWWLQRLPLEAGKPPVHLYNGRLKGNQNAHCAVMDIDVGSRNLQQCADAVIRLRAEYLYSRNPLSDIVFHFTSGDAAPWKMWREGWRPRVDGSRVKWEKSAAPDAGHAALRRYLDTVFIYAGTLSLSQELAPVADLRDIAGGDVFIRGGTPGHAVLVVDAAVNPEGRKVFLLAQSYMPAQEIHILVNPGDAALSPWYSIHFGATLDTPEWTFTNKDLKRFP